MYMSIALCINTTKIKYSSLALDRYCKTKEEVCVSYSVDYNTKSIVTASNLKFVKYNEYSFGPNACLEPSYFKRTAPGLKERLQDVDQVVDLANDAFDHCIKFSFAKNTVIGFLYGLVGETYNPESVIKTVEKECPYGDNRVLCIGIQQDWCDSSASDFALMCPQKLLANLAAS